MDGVDRHVLVNLTEGKMADQIPVYDPLLHYPPEGTKNSCLILALDATTFRVIGHTGRYLYHRVVILGSRNEDIGLCDVPSEPGFWIMDEGAVCSTDELAGNWRPAIPADFKRYEAAVPECFAVALEQLAAQVESFVVDWDPSYLDSDELAEECGQLIRGHAV